MSEWRDSNSRPLTPEASTLPTALHPDVSERARERERGKTRKTGFIVPPLSLSVSVSQFGIQKSINERMMESETHQFTNSPIHYSVGVARLELAAPSTPCWYATNCATPRCLRKSKRKRKRECHRGWYVERLFLFLFLFLFSIRWTKLMKS
jgi:hypothetical protein